MLKFLKALLAMAVFVAVVEPTLAQASHSEGHEVSDRFSGDSHCGPNPNRGR
jgi:hypothetical protein